VGATVPVEGKNSMQQMSAADRFISYFIPLENFLDPQHNALITNKCPAPLSGQYLPRKKL
jgi:hypothetical protein